MTVKELERISTADREHDCARNAIESAVRGGEIAPLNRIANAHIDRAVEAARSAGGQGAALRRVHELAEHARKMRRIHAGVYQQAAARALAGRGEVLNA